MTSNKNLCDATYKPPSRNRPYVEDLRIKLNRKRQEQETLLGFSDSRKAPPPDPAYNFLKDPLRDNDYDETANLSADREYQPYSSKFRNKREGDRGCHQFHRQRPFINKVHESETGKWKKDQRETNIDRIATGRAVPHVNWNRNGDTRKDGSWKNSSAIHKHNGSQGSSTYSSQQDSANIIVEVSNTTGERKCTIDNSKTITPPHTSGYNREKKSYSQENGSYEHHTGYKNNEFNRKKHYNNNDKSSTGNGSCRKQNIEQKSFKGNFTNGEREHEDMQNNTGFNQKQNWKNKNLNYIPKDNQKILKVNDAFTIIQATHDKTNYRQKHSDNTDSSKYSYPTKIVDDRKHEKTVKFSSCNVRKDYIDRTHGNNNQRRVGTDISKITNTETNQDHANNNQGINNEEAPLEMNIKNKNTEKYLDKNDTKESRNTSDNKNKVEPDSNIESNILENDNCSVTGGTTDIEKIANDTHSQEAEYTMNTVNDKNDDHAILENITLQNYREELNAKNADQHADLNYTFENVVQENVGQQNTSYLKTDEHSDVKVSSVKHTCENNNELLDGKVN